MLQPIDNQILSGFYGIDIKSANLQSMPLSDSGLVLIYLWGRPFPYFTAFMGKFGIKETQVALVLFPGQERNPFLRETNASI